MIEFDDAARIVLDNVRRTANERVPMRDAAGRVLAEAIHSDVDMPPFDKAMVDGYACRREDLAAALQCVETIAAGYPPAHTISAGQCAKIMTGAPMPEGADMVFMVEHSEHEDNGPVRFTGERSNDNIARRGSDVTTGVEVLAAGHRMRPHDIAMLASVGATDPLVAARPRVAIVATGDELVDPAITPGPAQIRNSNAHQLRAQVEAAGGEAVSIATARDTEESLREALAHAERDSDIVLFSGGVSMGEFDLVPGLLKANGYATQFEKIKIQPGKPTVFATSDSHVLFGLPGNPVSTYVIFELLAKPYLLHAMGHPFEPLVIEASLGETFTRKSGARKAWVPVRIDDAGRVRRVDYHGSAHIFAYVHADGIIAFPEGTTELHAGDPISVRLLGTRT